VEGLSPFLIGGPAYSGTTLLTLLLNAGPVTCLDEPDFGKPEQEHRNIPLLRRWFPDASFPDPPGRPLGPDEELAMIRDCAAALAPRILGVKTCGSGFLTMADRFQDAGLRVVGIVRDPRDTLVRDLTSGLGEEGFLAHCNEVWARRDRLDAVVRYEDLVREPEATLAQVVAALGLDIDPAVTWDPRSVPRAMFKGVRHDALAAGRITDERIGVWRQAGRPVSDHAQRVARRLGYDP
jgi:hypothetical protein